MIARSGASLVELITSLALIGILGINGAALLRSQAAMLRNTSERAALSETLRTAQGILYAELRDLTLRDVRDGAPDSIAIRVFRGSGIVCRLTSDGVVLRYRGLRAPDPAKDSLLIVGQERAVAFTLRADQPGCTPRSGEQLVTLAPADSLANGTLVLMFESGSYHISSRALRYRRGTEGRQPLTDELIDHRNSGFTLDSGGFRIRVRGIPGTDADVFVALRNR